MGEFLSSILKRIQNRASTTLFAVYLSFWAALHAEGIITLLFTDQDYIFQKYGILKNEYLFKYFFGVVNNPGEFALKQAIAIGLTALYVCFFARFILNPIYKIEIKYKYDRRIEKAKQERRLRDEKAKIAKAKVELVKAKRKTLELQQEIEKKDPKMVWRREYENLESKTGAVEIGELEKIYYGRKGWIPNSLGEDYMLRDRIATCESLELFERDKQDSDLIRITEKGWYFMRRYKGIEK